MNMNEVVKGIVLSKACSIKPDKDSTESKTVTLSIKFEGVTLQSVFDKAVSSAVIQWQNGPGRTKFDEWKHGQVVVVEFKAPGRAPQVSPQVQFKADAIAAGVDMKDKAAVLAFYEEWITK
jgi:hypothetical protein